MNKKLLFCVWLVGNFVLSGSTLWAETRPIHVEWSYPGVAVRFVLYQDGVQSCVSNDPGAMQMDCSIELASTPMTFTLAAVDAAGVESPQSAPYILTPPTIDPVTGNYIPEASFTVSAASGPAPLPVGFDADGSSDLGGVIVSYDWDFGDGGTASGILADYTYDSPGIYTVTLTVVDDAGATAVKTATITVAAPPPTPNQLPTAVLNATTLVAGTSQLRFDALASTDADGTIVSYAWNFGDGDSALGVQVDHEYRVTGDYMVVLTVTDNQGGVDTDQMIMTVVDPPPSANAPPTALISASAQQRLMHMEWEYSGADPELAGFRLYQNGRFVCEIADPAARQGECLAYIDTGEVRLWLTAYDQAGVETSPSVVLRFDNSGLQPEAGGDSPLLVHFTPGASVDPDGVIMSYEWNFGDGTTATGMEADHLFAVPGEYAVTMTVTDNNGGQAHASTIVTVRDGHPPVAVGGTFATDQNKSLTATLSASDLENRPLTYTLTKAASLGTATITDPVRGVFTYVPQAGEYGEDSFSFKVDDGTFDSNEAVVAITVRKTNSAPTALGQDVTLTEDGTWSGILQATDAEFNPLNFSLEALPVHGTVVLTNRATGEFVYTPNPDYSGADSFTFRANDGELDSAVATVNLAVAPVNDAPGATGFALWGTEDIGAPGVLLGTDTDGDALTFSIVANGEKGNVVITDEATGEFVYTPNANANGEDSFTYRVSDGRQSVEAKVSVAIASVNDQPVATADLAQVKVGRRVVVRALANDSDVDGDPLTLISVTSPQYGKATIVEGTVAYAASRSYAGNVTFGYVVSDGKGGTVNGSITIKVVR